VASCVNPPAFAYVVVGRYFSSLGPLIASARWSSIPWRWYELGGFIGPPPRPRLASVLLVSPVVLVVVSPVVLVVSPLHLLLVLALLVSSSFSRSRGLPFSRLSHPSSSSSSSSSSRPVPPSRVAFLLLIVPPAPPCLASPPPPRLAPAPCHLTPPHCCRVALWIRPSPMSSLRALSLSGPLPSSSLPGPYIDRD